MAGPYALGQNLLDAIRDWSARPDLEGRCPEFLRLAEQQLERDLKARYLAVSTTGTLTAGSELLALPTDCLEPRRFWLTTQPERLIEIVSVEDFVAQRSLDQSDYPACAVHQGLNLKLAPTPADAYPYELLYHARITGLTAGTSNWLLENAPDVLLYGSLRQMSAYLRDLEGVAHWDSFYAPAWKDLRRSEWRAKYGAGYSTIRPDGPTP